MNFSNTPQDHLAQALEKAEKQQINKHYQEAITTLLGALNQGPATGDSNGSEGQQTQFHTETRCHQNLSHCYRQRGWLDKARWHGRKAAMAFAAGKLPIETAAAQAELGELELAARSYKTAQAWFSQAAAGFTESQQLANAGLASLGACQAQAEILPQDAKSYQKLAESRFHAIHAVECHGDGHQRLAAQRRAEEIARLLGEPQAAAWHMEQQVHLLEAENKALRAAQSSTRETLAIAPDKLPEPSPAPATVVLHQFMEKAAHDMKEPLRMISSFGSLLNRRCGDALGEEGQEFLETVLDAGQRMNSLMEKLVQHAQWGVEEPGTDMVALDDMLLLALQPYRDLQQAGNLLLTHEHLGHMPGKAAHWVAVWTELIANAVRFHAGDVVRLHLARETQPGVIWLRFSDNGIGIEEAYRESVFELFRRLHPRSDYAGSGIGLAIVARIAGLYGGQVRAEAAADGGTCIVLGFPNGN